MRKRLHLDKVLIAPLRAEVGLSPAVEHVHDGDVIPRVATVEVLVSVVCMHLLVLGPVEDGVAHRNHGRDGGHLL